MKDNKPKKQIRVQDQTMLVPSMMKPIPMMKPQEMQMETIVSNIRLKKYDDACSKLENPKAYTNGKSHTSSEYLSLIHI